MSRKILDFFKPLSNPKEEASKHQNVSNSESLVKESLSNSKSKQDKLSQSINASQIHENGNKTNGSENKSTLNDEKSDSDDEIKLNSRKRIRKISSDSDNEDSELTRKKSKIIKNKENLSIKLNTTKEKNLKLKKNTENNTPVQKLLSKFHNKSIETDFDDSQLNLSIDAENNNNNLIHLTYNFLKPTLIRDKQGRRSNDPEYDPTSLMVPESFMVKLTPGMKQWWSIKSDGNMDKILFFKVGKFYETYHMDAVICVNELNLSYMAGNYAHSGFPEIAFPKMADQLVFKGHKVARIEQTESVEAMTERIKSSNATKNRVVNREMCQVITAGTRTFNLQSGISRNMASLNDDTNANITMITDSRIDILMAIKEAPKYDDRRCNIDIGLAFVNPSIGKFTLTQFEDDKHRSKLKTILSRFPPTEILYEKGNLSRQTNYILNTTLASVHKESLQKFKQFYSSTETLCHLLEDNYFIDTPTNKLSPQYQLPLGLVPLINTNDNLGRTASEQYDSCVSCLGALLYYLKECLIDKYLVSFGEFELFDFDNKNNDQNDTKSQSQKYLILDSVTMENLDLLRNNSTGTADGTLLERLDFTLTPFGHRLLIQWISCPLYQTHEIISRQDAIQDLIELDSQLQPIKTLLGALPDLEKLLSKIHSIGVHKSIKDHPNTRAIMYNNAVYSKRQIGDFLAALDGFQVTLNIQEQMAHFILKQSKIKSNLLKKLLLTEKQAHKEGTFPIFQDALNYFKNAFNMDIAKSEGKIIPEKGIDADYDEAIRKIEKFNGEKESYLNEQRRLLKCAVSFVGTGKNGYQLEIPESKTKNLPTDYFPTSQRKGYKRYQTTETQRILNEMLSAEEQRDTALKNVMCRVFSKFDEYYSFWSKVIENIAQLDVLIALSVFSKGLGISNNVRPKIEDYVEGQQPYLSIEEGRYPCRGKTDNDDFIPNTIKLGIDDVQYKPVMLLTGPNMGGKSTLMRQVAITVVLAQVGCFIPAEGPVSMTPVDRLLTRQGANDAISYGQSTLQVELTETSHILNNMTHNSLLLIDELGRGTATHDGCALARSILYTISSYGSVVPRVVFSTHFHKLLEDTEIVHKLQIAHMACVVEDDDDDTVMELNQSNNEDNKLQNITFLYKLTKGGCPKSYGFNAAKLANIPHQIILKGLRKARIFEEETLMKDFERMLLNNQQQMSLSLLKNWQEKFRKLLF